MVSHVVLILSETNPIICAASFPIRKNTGGFCLGFCSLHPRGTSQGLPRLLYHANLRAQMGRLEWIRFYCGTLGADRVLAVEEKKEVFKTPVADLGMQMRDGGGTLVVPDSCSM